MQPQPQNKYYLLEYDKRFRCYGDSFVFYDVNRARDIPDALKHQQAIVVCDPPFLSEDCFVKGNSQFNFFLLQKYTNIILLYTI